MLDLGSQTKRPCRLMIFIESKTNWFSACHFDILIASIVCGVISRCDWFPPLNFTYLFETRTFNATFKCIILVKHNHSIFVSPRESPASTSLQEDEKLQYLLYQGIVVSTLLFDLLKNKERLFYCVSKTKNCWFTISIENSSMNWGNDSRSRLFGRI